MKFYTIYKTSFGSILIIMEDGYLTNIYIDADNEFNYISKDFIKSKEACNIVTDQLDLYFKGKLKNFDIKIKPNGTLFQQRAWKALLKIPYGKTISYKEQAILMENPNSTRAVGNANGKNPIPIVIPCHRVIKNDGSLGGFSSGIDKKVFLLNLEKGNMNYTSGSNLS